MDIKLLAHVLVNTGNGAHLLSEEMQKEPSQEFLDEINERRVSHGRAEFDMTTLMAFRRVFLQDMGLVRR